MGDTNKDGADRVPATSRSANPDKDGRGQALQINENTLDDPKSPESDVDDDLRSRSDVPNTDQALQINENSIGDKD